MEVIFYETRSGKIPVNDFLASLNEKLEAKTVRTIELFGELGMNLREPLSKPLDDGIFELRTKFGKDITRVLFFFIHDDRAVLTHGFVKKTRKTPFAEINRAKQYRKDYLARN